MYIHTYMYIYICMYKYIFKVSVCVYHVIQHTSIYKIAAFATCPDAVAAGKTVFMYQQSLLVCMCVCIYVYIDTCKPPQAGRRMRACCCVGCCCNVSYSVLQCVAVCCSVLQCITAFILRSRCSVTVGCYCSPSPLNICKYKHIYTCMCL